MNEQKSEVAQLLHRISLEYKAAQRGLTGLSVGSAKHSFIIARLEQIQVYHDNSPALSAKREQHNLSSNWQKSCHPRKMRQVDPLNSVLVRQGDGKAVKSSEHETVSFIAFVAG